MGARGWVAVALVTLGGCAEPEPVDGGWRALDFLPTVGTEIELIPPDLPDEEPLLVQVGEGTWALREGPTWDEAAPRGEVAAEVVDGALWLDGAVALPASLALGSGGGVDVTGLGERETWYGTFDRAVTVVLTEGALAGEWAFGEGVGPIFVTLDGESWDLATYRP